MWREERIECLERMQYLESIQHLETLAEFCQRTEGFSRNSLPLQGDFCTSPGLGQKVDGTGWFKPYRGNTVIFRLGDVEYKQQKGRHSPAKMQAQIEGIKTRLYARCGNMLAEPLPQCTFHITLHDLQSEGGAGSPEFIDQMEKSGRKAREIISGFRKYFHEPLRLRGTWVFNLVNTSIVLGFRPEDEDSCRRLMAMYQELQAAAFLPYPLTPHVTLAYYRPGAYGQEDLERLRQFLEEENQQTFEIMEDSAPSVQSRSRMGKDGLVVNLDFSDLAYAEFLDMKDF